MRRTENLKHSLNYTFRTLQGIFKSKFKKTAQKEELNLKLYNKINNIKSEGNNEKTACEEFKHIFVHFVSYFFEKAIKIDFFILFK